MHSVFLSGRVFAFAFWLSGRDRRCRLLQPVHVQAPALSPGAGRDVADGGYTIEQTEPVVPLAEARTGKTHLATALCVAACRHKPERRVPVTTAANLITQLVEARRQNRLRRTLQRWLKYDLLARDEVGCVPPPTPERRSSSR